MKHSIFVFLITALAVLTYSCKEEITNPTEPTPGRRDYVWTVDTLNAPFNYFSSLWGATPNDIWTVGSGGDDYLWHFDGAKWSSYNKEKLVRGGKAITGFAGNNVWMVGDEGYIWHYDGNTWKVNFIYEQSDGFAYPMDIWGRNASDIYVCGVINLQSKKEQRGYILHYNGVKWEEYYKADYISQFNSIIGNDKNVLVKNIKLIFEPNNNIWADSTSVLEVGNHKLNKIFIQKGEGQISLSTVANKLHVVIDNSVFKYENGVLQHLIEINLPNFAHRVFGRDNKDLFISMLDGICHYNGSDITYLYKFDTIFSYYVGKPLDFGDELFFNIPHTRKLHGKLK